MMEPSWEIPLHQMEILGSSDEDDDEFLRDILLQPDLSPDHESQSLVVQKKLQPRTFILSFDNSTILPASATSERGTHSNSKSSNNSALSSRRKRNLEKNHVNLEPKLPSTTTQRGKKNRSDSQTMDHVMAERKRRQDLTEKFIALSATIPGLKKTDKTSIVHSAIDYVKQLKERVTELEQQGNGRGKESMIVLKKMNLSANHEDTHTSHTTSSETNNSEDLCRPRELFPDVKARVLENEVLIVIHCERENGIELKILDLLENLRLCVTGTSVLPFGNSTLSITIIAQIGDACEKTTVTDIVENVRQALLNDDTSNRFRPQLSY